MFSQNYSEHSLTAMIPIISLFDVASIVAIYGNFEKYEAKKSRPIKSCITPVPYQMFRIEMFDAFPVSNIEDGILRKIGEKSGF